MTEETKKFDDKGNLIYCKDHNGYEQWFEYDENNWLVCAKDNYGLKSKFEYDKHGRLVHGIYKDGTERFRKYTEDGFIRTITKKEFEHLEFTSREPINPFELLDIE